MSPTEGKPLIVLIEYRGLEPVFCRVWNRRPGISGPQPCIGARSNDAGTRAAREM